MILLLLKDIMLIDLGKFNDEQLNFEILAEECAEVIQIKSKISRFGLFSEHPETKITNRDQLVQELGVILAMIDIHEKQGVFHWDELIDAKYNKFDKLEKYYS